MPGIKKVKSKKKKKSTKSKEQVTPEPEPETVATVPQPEEAPKKKKKRKASNGEPQTTKAKKKKKRKVVDGDVTTKKKKKKTTTKKKNRASEEYTEEKKQAGAEAVAETKATPMETKDDDAGFLGMTRAVRPDPRLGQTRLFLGNLSFKIDEAQLRSTFEHCGEVASIHWVLDKATGKFYGTAFIEFADAAAALAALKMDGKKVLQRPMKVKWATGGGKGGATNRKGPADIKNLKASEKPEGCTTCFLGNLPYDVDEETVREFFKDCGEVTDVRWVTKDEEFKGAGFVEFATTESTDLAVKLNGKELGSRYVRVDYAPNRPGRG